MNCITDFLPDDTSEHNADGENMDEIVFGIQPAPTLTPQALDAAIYGTSEYWQQMSSASIEAHTETLERVKVLEAENARLKAALEWYADAANYVENWTSTSVYCPDSSDAQRDEGERARKALKPE